MSQTELKCTRYYYLDDDEPHVPCKCPVCGGFLKWENEKPFCSKCGADLLVIPEKDEETGEEMEQGKICPISKRKR